MNKVVLIGRLTKDPELRFTPGTGTAVTTFTLAINRPKKKDEKQEADFIPVVVWGKQAENAANYLSKGSQCAISGRIQTRSYDAKDGTKRYVTEVVADMVGGVQFLGGKNPMNQDEAGANNFEDMNQDPFNYSDEPVEVQDDGTMPF